MMAFCTNCGTKVADGTKFCPSCGQKTASREQAAAPVKAEPVQPVQPPVQQSFTPPVQQEQPKQAAYTAHGQQSHAAPAQTVHAAAPKQKKPINKKMLFIIGGAVLAAIIVLVLILVFCSGGGKTNEVTDANLGVYNAISAEMMDMEMDVTDMFEDGVTIELKEKGKCAMNVDGSKGNGKWTLEDGEFHIKGGKFDCDGTLENGVLTLENVLDMGVTLTFEKEGGYFPDDAGGGAAAALPGNSAGGEATVLQKQWNGTWYGCMYVKEATGDFSGISSGSGGYYDTYMVVDVDGKGKGQFAVYLANADEAFAIANCEAKEAGLYAIDGTVAGGIDMYAYNWMFLPMPDYPDQYSMNDIIEDGDSLFEFTLFMKQWGGSWQEEIDSDFNIVPPSVESYMAAIENGELPPVGFAPVDYDGSAASSSASGSSDDSGSASDAEGESMTLTGEVDAYNYCDEIYVSYPIDTFSVGNVNGLEAIVAKDGSVEISIDVKYTEGGHEYTMQYMDGLSTEQDYNSTNMTIAGYDTRCVTYYDPSRLRPYYANYHVCFKDEGYANYGINFYVTSADSAEACTSETVLAILNTLTIAQ